MGGEEGVREEEECLDIDIDREYYLSRATHPHSSYAPPLFCTGGARARFEGKRKLGVLVRCLDMDMIRDLVTRRRGMGARG